jgi:hypothetical protein
MCLSIEYYENSCKVESQLFDKKYVKIEECILANKKYRVFEKSCGGREHSHIPEIPRERPWEKTMGRSWAQSTRRYDNKPYFQDSQNTGVRQ